MIKDTNRVTPGAQTHIHGLERPQHCRRTRYSAAPTYQHTYVRACADAAKYVHTYINDALELLGNLANQRMRLLAGTKLAKRKPSHPAETRSP